MTNEMVTVQNSNTPGRTENVRADKYHDMRTALLNALPASAPGLPFSAVKAALLPHLSPTLFADGKTAGWWAKCVQLDLEAKGLITRLPTKPLTFHKN